MINIADAIILAGLVGLIAFLWNERSRMLVLEEENDELWDNLSRLADVVSELEDKINGDEDTD